MAELGFALLTLLLAAENCLAEAFRAVKPDGDPPCPALDPASLHNCLSTQSYSRIVVLLDMKLNATVFPPSMSDSPTVISRNITLESDGRGPRMVLDCALLTDRFQIPAGVTVLAHHIVPSNCTIGAERLLSFLRFNQGSQLIVNSSFVLQPSGLCLPHQQQLAAFSHEVRAAGVRGSQRSFKIGQAAAWCAASPNTRAPTDRAAGAGSAPTDRAADTGVAPVILPTETADDNSSYSKLPPIPLEYANRTGLGPTYAATLDQPARSAFYTHPT
jgi:hypothetical protein